MTLTNVSAFKQNGAHSKNLKVGSQDNFHAFLKYTSAVNVTQYAIVPIAGHQV